MRNLYSAIWMSHIQAAKNNKDPKVRDGWKLTVWFVMSSFSVMNFLTIIFTLQCFLDFNYSVVDYFGIQHYISSGLAGFVDYMLLFYVLGYFCFFYKDRYKKLLPKYGINKRLGLWYMYISVVLFFAMLVLTANC